MSEKIPYSAPDGAVGYITDVTNENFYKNPKIDLYDGLEQDCYELVCNFAELVGVELDREEPDFSLANHIRDTVIKLLEKEFGIPFPVYGETDLDRDIRLRDAKSALFKLEHQAQYEELCLLAAEQGDVCIHVDAEHRQFVIDSGSSESLMAIAEQLGISSDNICNSPVDHVAYVEVEKEPSQEKFVFLWPCADGKWNATISDVVPNNESAKFTEVGVYPVSLYFYRVDINGSGSLEREICKDEKELIENLNWIGECGYTPASLWKFDINRVEDEKLANILSVAAQHRSELIHRDLDEQISVASTAKEYELTLFQGEEDEEIVRAVLTDEQVELIRKDISGILNSGHNITLVDGTVIDTGIIDGIKVLDGDHHISNREKNIDVERE